MGKESEQVEASGQPSAPQTIDQVRELLFGAEQRTLEEQLKGLREDMHGLQADLEHKIETARAELKQALVDTDADHKARLTQVGSAIEEVGRAIGSIAKR